MKWSKYTRILTLRAAYLSELTYSKIKTLLANLMKPLTGNKNE